MNPENTIPSQEQQTREEQPISVTLTKPEELSEEQMSEILDKLPAIEKWVKNVKEYALSNVLETGAIYPGYQIKEFQKRKIEDKEAALATIKAFNEDLYLQCIRPQDLKTMTELQRIMGKFLFTNLLRPHITVETTLRLVKEGE